MDQQAKRAIKFLVLKLRKKLEYDIAVQLKRYGFAGERWLPVEQLPHIQQDDHSTIDHFRLNAALEQHLRRIGAEPAKATAEQRAEAVDWFVREVAFTHLNRLVALKCLEVRGLIPEIITTRDAYGGRSRGHHNHRNDHPTEAAQPDDALPAAIRRVCGQVYAEFRFLFDVGDPATGRVAPTNSLLWPSYPALKECIGLINSLDKKAGHQDGSLWTEDEIIGWIYQFYNTEEKQAIRKRGRPRVPAEVAVINQFFTPRWIVKFLVDNTLGRLWLEMHPDSERVRAKCDYLVPEPLAADEEAEQADAEGRFRLDPDSPINDPGAVPRRDPKRPQDIRLIDPACGTMHFGHYAFEVFQGIYRDATDRGWVTGEDALPEGEIPEAILRHNLYGVDIDLRAVQLAGLSLFIKAKTANPTAHISHLNLVLADAVLPADGARQRFLEQYKDDKVVQDAVRQVLDEMANVAEVGSLLRVEERLRDILVAAGHEAVQDWDLDRLQELPGFERPLRQLSLAENSGAVPEQWGAHYTLARLLDDLRDFAAEALQTHDLNAQLFAEEAEKSVHLLDVFLNDYDVVVMNPPYGHGLDQCKELVKELYPDTHRDLYSMFVERASRLVAPAKGYVGALTSRTFLRLTTFQKFRERELLADKGLTTLADLGWGVLDDALIETAAYVVGPSQATRLATFFRLNDEECKEASLQKALAEARDWRRHKLASTVPLSEFALLPGSPLCYWTTLELRRKFSTLPTLHPRFAYVGTGTSHPRLFCRYHWEVGKTRIGPGKKWVGYANGGPHSLCYRDVHQVSDWEDNGRRPKEEVCRRYPYLNDNYGFVVQSEQYYFREGITFGKRSEFFSVQHLPTGNIFSDEGQSIFPADEKDIWPYLAILNSAPVCYYLLLTAGVHKHRMYVRRIPVPELKIADSNRLSSIARHVHALKASWDTGNETCTRFDVPWLVQAQGDGVVPDFSEVDLAKPRTKQLTLLLDYVCAAETSANVELQRLQAEIDEATYDLYEISPEDRVLIERELRGRPADLVWPPMGRKPDEEKRREHVRRLISYFLLEALKEARDGVLPLSPGTGLPTVLDRVRIAMEAEFGDEAAFRMESDIKDVLGKSIADWLDKDFFKWHTKLYKRRPFIWHLASPASRFGCFVYIQKLDRDTLRKVQTQYLWPARRTAEGEFEAAKSDKDSRCIEQAESAFDDLEEFEKRLLRVIRGEVESDIPEWAEGPFRGGVYDPVLDDGVKVNITPLQEAGLLRHKKVV